MIDLDHIEDHAPRPVRRLELDRALYRDLYAALRFAGLDDRIGEDGALDLSDLRLVRARSPWLDAPGTDGSEGRG